MKWYAAKLVFHIDISAEVRNQQFDESIRLIQANSFESAVNAAKLLGEKEESAFFNHAGEKIHWRFINISSLYPIEKIEHGVEVCAEIIEKKDASEYSNLINYKAKKIQSDPIIMKYATHLE